MSLSEEALKAFEALKQACMQSPVLAFADYTKDFLLETDASKEELGLPFYETGVSGIKVGCHRTLQRISAIPTLTSENQ